MRRLTVASVVLVLALGPGATLAAEEEPAASGTFSPAGSLAQARTLHTSTLLPDGRVLTVGGAVGDDPTLAEAWDPATASFGPAGPLAEARVFHTTTLLPDGRVLVVGGCCDDDFTSLASTEVWDPATGTFAPAGSLDEARGFHTATLLPGGRVLVVGGWDGHEVITAAEVWEPGDG